MKYPKPKFKVGDRVRVDEFDNATIAEVGLFRKRDSKKIIVKYKLTENILPGFWSEEKRLKKI